MRSVFKIISEARRRARASFACPRSNVEDIAEYNRPARRGPSEGGGSEGVSPSVGRGEPFQRVPPFELNEKGIALLLVIGSLVVITMLAVEFAYNAQIEYQMAHRQKQRLQAFYLAHSAYQLTLLELKMGNAVQAQVGRAVEQANIELPVDLSAPLCEQFPVNTALLRMMAAGGGAPPEEEGGAKEELAKGKGAAEGEPAEGEAGEEGGLFEGGMGFGISGLEDFLKFDGDFESACFDESARIDLNFFFNQNPDLPAPEGALNLYDGYKDFVARFLSQERFSELFAGRDITPQEVVRNIADWVDTNEVINEPGGGQGGAEESPYRNVAPGRWMTKNGKFSTPGEIFRVAGVTDDWWTPVSEYFTIYGMADQKGNPQINVCRAPEELVEALIMRYVEMRKDLPPLPPGDTEILAQWVEAVYSGCTGTRPDKNMIAQNLDTALARTLRAAPAVETPAGGFAPAATPFADWIATASRFYRLQLKGRVGETQVGVEAILDLGEAGGGDTRKWKLVYWKVN